MWDCFAFSLCLGFFCPLGLPFPLLVAPFLCRIPFTCFPWVWFLTLGCLCWNWSCFRLDFMVLLHSSPLPPFAHLHGFFLTLNFAFSYSIFPFSFLYFFSIVFNPWFLVVLSWSRGSSSLSIISVFISSCFTPSSWVFLYFDLCLFSPLSSWFLPSLFVFLLPSSFLLRHPFFAHPADINAKIYALGNDTNTAGMNQKLLPWFKARKGSRFGVVLSNVFVHSSRRLSCALD